ncbi:hypothetical protein [Dorea sp. D27]|uniref:hypothetical protein n=1 Tax=Dorea sp. D27 TaxID=658665 RepID=UPI000673744F|nr:hypothetical protein [Dorea sp. D27]KMZ52330.1 hypothetical protein HMPREF0980_03532 [Dorea sp. D27]
MGTTDFLKLKTITGSTPVNVNTGMGTNFERIDEWASTTETKISEDAAALEAFKGSVIDGADEIWATTQDGIPAGAHGVSRLITSVRTTITQKVAELTEKITANTAKADANAAALAELNSKLSNMYDGGTASVTAVLNSAITFTITFNKNFINIPAFTCQIETGQVTADKITIKSVTNKKADLFLYTSSANHAVKVHWNAVSLDSNL